MGRAALICPYSVCRSRRQICTMPTSHAWELRLQFPAPNSPTRLPKPHPCSRPHWPQEMVFPGGVHILTANLPPLQRCLNSVFSLFGDGSSTACQRNCSHLSIS